MLTRENHSIHLRNFGFELQFFQSSNRRRAKTEVMEEISSQNSVLGLRDLDKLEAKECVYLSANRFPAK